MWETIIVRDYKNIFVWQKSYSLVLEIYKITQSFPKHELYGLTSQIRRAAVSIPSNIAEGASRSSEVDFARFLEISLGSAFEMECQLLLAKDLGYVSDPGLGDIMQEIDEIKKMIYSLRKAVSDKQ